ncbi:hypothetical protein HMN09_00435200 [Mycena chlorophos]|uniref:G-protein coupled receptors family 2 profile 2 domain-containing protein n=1 Tax=Mycena chlorophos TaxID=658473 RepID=A0A8H6TE88_MYCCL|nr:hypothetical protein HMN09_00435200 [Mycena chlorophos]
MSSFLQFTPQETPGVIIVIAAAIISLISLLTVVLRVVWLARRFLDPSAPPPREYLFFGTVLGQYSACLMLASLLSGAAGLVCIDQLIKGGIQEGMLCTAQAIIMQVANFGLAYFTVALGIHTFTSLALSRRQSRLVSAFTIVIGWTGAGLFAAAPFLVKLNNGAPYGISGLSCGIRNVYPSYMFFFHLLPILLASIISAVLYSLSYLVLRGTLKIRGGLKLSLDPNERWSGGVQNYHKFVARISRSMIWFPIAYICLLVPYSVTRLIELSGAPCPFALLVAAYVCWFALNIANVVALYNTFRVLGPAFDARTTQKDLESKGSSTRSTKTLLPPMIAAGDDLYRSHTIQSEKTFSRPNSMSSWNQVQAAPMENPAAPSRLRAPPLAARIQDRREDSAASLHSRTDSNLSAPSFYEYGGSTQGPPRPTRLSALLLNEPPVVSRVRSLSRGTAPPQPAPMQSLPAPPRPVKKQVQARRPVTMSEPGSPHGSIEVQYSDKPNALPVSAFGNSHVVPSIPANDNMPLRAGSLDVSRSRSAQATVSRPTRVSDPRATTRLSTPEPRPPNKF